MTEKFTYYVSENQLYSTEYPFEEFSGIVHEINGSIYTESETVEFHGQHTISHMDISIESGKIYLLNNSGKPIKSAPIDKLEFPLWEEFIYRNYHTIDILPVY